MPYILFFVLIPNTGLPPNQENQGVKEKSGNFVFNQGNLGKIERYFEKSGEIREVLEMLLIRFRVVTFYMITPASS